MTLSLDERARAGRILPTRLRRTETWETREHLERWHTASVKPHLPPDAPEPTITQLHNALSR